MSEVDLTAQLTLVNQLSEWNFSNHKQDKNAPEGYKPTRKEVCPIKRALSRMLAAALVSCTGYLLDQVRQQNVSV
jgi:hypothetical protein